VATVEALVERRAVVPDASYSPRWPLDVSLRAVGLARYFAVTLAGDEVTRRKPAPDLYLAAARRLGVTPHDCAAVKDTSTGVASAAAGMRVVAVVRGDGDRDSLDAAGRVVNRLGADLYVCPW
jgi:beta-phosphoglucomutase-like phosphatase (HAD superfamily)